MTAHEHPPAPHPHWRRYAGVLALGTFVVGTDSFVISGVLPEVADTLGLPASRVGSMVTVFSAVYAICAVPMVIAGSRIPRRLYFPLALGIVAAGNLLTIAAHSLPPILVARAITALGAAAYTAAATATAAELAGPERRGSAVATVLLGMTIALVLGSPIGAALATAFTWHTPFVVLATAAVLVALVLSSVLPRDLAVHRVGPRHLASLLTDARIAAVLARTLAVFTGVYMVYTYLSVVLAPVRADGVTMATALTVFGLSASTGVFLAGRVVTSSRSARVVLAGCSLLVLAAVLALLGARFLPLPALVAVGVFGLASFAVNPSLQHQLITLAARSRSQLATALFQTVLYAGASAGAALGTGLLPLGGVPVLLVVAALLLLCSLTPPLLGAPRSRHRLLAVRDMEDGAHA